VFVSALLMCRPPQETVAKVSLAAFKPNESKNTCPPQKEKSIPSPLSAMPDATCPPTISDKASADGTPNTPNTMAAEPSLNPKNATDETQTLALLSVCAEP